MVETAQTGLPRPIKTKTYLIPSETNTRRGTPGGTHSVLTRPSSACWSPRAGCHGRLVPIQGAEGYLSRWESGSARGEHMSVVYGRSANHREPFSLGTACRSIHCSGLHMTGARSRRQDRDSSRMVATTARPACRAPLVAECGSKLCRVSSFRAKTN